MSNRSERFLPQFTNTVTTVQFYQIGYSFTFLLGFLGNISSLLTFSRPTLRKVSTGCLFMALAISDMLFLLTCIIDFLEFGLNVSLAVFSSKENLFPPRSNSFLRLLTMNSVDFEHLSCPPLNWLQLGF